MSSNHSQSVSQEPTHLSVYPGLITPALLRPNSNEMHKDISVTLNKLVLEPILLLMLTFQEHWPSVLSDSHVGLMVGDPCSGILFSKINVISDTHWEAALEIYLSVTCENTYGIHEMM